MMLVAKEFGLSPPGAVAPRRRAPPARVAAAPPWGAAPPRGGGGGGSPVGELWLRTRGGGPQEGLGSHGGGGSHDSELDLALLVSDFLEGGSGDSSDSDSGGLSPDLAHLADNISMYKQAGDEKENELLSVVHSLLFSIHESELQPFIRGQCTGSCIRHLLVKLLRYAGYDAAVCVSKWQLFDKIPGGDHEYIDVLTNSGAMMAPERLIIDIDFRSHFEIARAVDSYGALLDSLPVVYVGTLPRLKQFLNVMVNAAKWSLKQNSMPLPPWRSLAYLQAKWQSKYERKNLDSEQEFQGTATDRALCVGHLKRLKSSLQSELDTGRLLMMPIQTDTKRRAKFDRRLRRSLLSF